MISVLQATRSWRSWRGQHRTYGLQLLLAATLTAGVAIALTTPTGDPDPQVKQSFAATSDAMLDSTHPSAPAGSGSLRVDGSPEQLSLLRFQVSGTREITRATLRLWAESPGFGGTEVRRTSGTWSETTGWHQRPQLGAKVAGIGKHQADRWVTADVTDVVTSNGTVDFALAATGTAAERYASREAGRHAPHLEVTAARVNLPRPTLSPTRPPGATVNGPVRAAFYYPWFPESWKQQGFAPFTSYHPSAGFYDSGDPASVDRSFDDLRYAGMNALISSWWGPGTPTDERLPLLLSRAPAKGLQVAAYYEKEGPADPSVSELHSDLLALLASATNSASYLRVEGKPVVFVYGGPEDGCDMAKRWSQANDLGLYLVLKVFKDFRACDAAPQAWHQYAPAARSVTVGSDSVTVSPGFWKKGERTPRLARDLAAFEQAVIDMAGSGARFQLVSTYNEWGEGTSVESGREWASKSGRGGYLDVLHRRLALDPVVAAAGDIACASHDRSFNDGQGTKQNCRMEATSDLLAALDPAVVLPLGDVQYECADSTEFSTSYDKTWGRFKARTRPAIGNHEYGRACRRNDPSPYFDYFGTSAGNRYEGWYSYDIGAWHLIALNSECHYGSGRTATGGCEAGSPQETWLRQDLAAHRALCTLAYWHEPRWSSGQHGDAQQMATIWNDLVAARADVVLAGHNHVYERFDLLGAARQDTSTSGNSTTTGSPSFQQPVLDPTGVRQFVVGTGGKNHYGFKHPPLRGEQVRNDDVFGVLALTLHPTGYDWRFVPEPGTSFTDMGSDRCH